MHPFVAIELVELALRFGEIALGMECRLQRTPCRRGLALGGHGCQLGGAELGRRALVIGM